MSTWLWVFDLGLIVSLLALAGRALLVADLFQTIVLFIAFGLLMALAWVRLEAPDIALAEAAIGSGLTGVLLLDALRQMGSKPTPAAAVSSIQSLDSSPRRLTLRRATVLILVFALAGLFGSVVLELPREPGGLTALVAQHLSQSGVDHAVTAVLLNFRGYDTWLELAVLVLALAGCLGVLQQRDLSHALPPAHPSEVLITLVRLLVPVMVLVSGYLLWLGTVAAGGAFQAGVVLAAAWVLMWFAGWRGLAAAPLLLWRGLVVAGVTGFFVAAVLTLLGTGVLFRFPTAHAGAIILILELLATVSIGVTLSALILAPQGREQRHASGANS